MADLVSELEEVVGRDAVLAGDAIGDDWAHDEAITATPHLPEAVVLPSTVEQVAAIVEVAVAHGVPVTARGSGTGLSGACIPRHGGIVVGFERMAAILEIDPDNHVAVVQPGVTLAQLDEALAPLGLLYPVQPGENSATLGGNVSTNAGGMRAVKYGVTRHQVLGLQAVLGTGEVVRSGGRFVKSTSGYDLTQLIIGSEGTLALVTEVTLRLHPRPRHATTMLAPFASMHDLGNAISRILDTGIGPVILESADRYAMGGIERASGNELGVSAEVREQATCYLIAVLEDRSAVRLDEDAEEVAILLAELGALDVYGLPPQAGAALISARERMFWAAKASKVDEIVDVVVPRASIPSFLDDVRAMAEASGSFVVGCGHAGDGNVHMSVFQSDPDVRKALLFDLYGAGIARGGAISGEHGIGSEKRPYLEHFEDPAKLALMARVKAAFDPHGIFNPGAIWERRAGS
jgi:glycolate oxidase